MEFSSEGYDLDALSSGQEGVLEVGGGATTVVDQKSALDDDKNATCIESNDDDCDDNGKKKKIDEDNDPEVAMMEMAADYKLQGNAAFQKRDWKEAMEFYGAAIRATPGMTGEALLELQSKWIEEETLRIRKEMAADDQKRREIQEKKRKSEKVDDEDDEEEEEATSASAAAEESKRRNGGQAREAIAAFRAPHHKHGKDLAVYHCNRAAAMMMLLQEQPAEPQQSTPTTDDAAAGADATTNNNTLETSYERVISDCTVAILLNPGYAKALARRAVAYEKTEQTDKALEDVRRAARLDPSNRKYRAEIERLRKLEEERMEKLKAETMEKLKDLGNSILGNFGLSLDNFKAEQDPKTGSYNIAFQQNK